MKINRLLTNICADDLVATKHFYLQLFDFKVSFDSDWFIQLVDDESSLELGIVKRENDLIPAAFQQAPQGFYLTFVVEDVEAVYEMAKDHQFKIVEPPTNTFYGQRRLLLQDPSGTLVDVSALIPNFQFNT